MLKEIVNQVGYIRTLDEILDVYEKNPVEFDRKSHPDFPSPPPNAFIRYMQENREKFEAELKAKGEKNPAYVSPHCHQPLSDPQFLNFSRRLDWSKSALRGSRSCPIRRRKSTSRNTLENVRNMR
jgi:hypothetical protein